LQTAHKLVSTRDDTNSCCFVDNLPSDLFDTVHDKLIYRHFASLFFIVIADSSESELGILDLLQVFVHVLDRYESSHPTIAQSSCFENICELDIVYHYDRVNYVLDEMVMAGMVVESNSDVIISTISDINSFVKAT
jgi:AP-3 complex subunit sigma